MKFFALLCGRDGLLEGGLGEGCVSDEVDEFVCFALTERGSNGRDAVDEFLEMGAE